MDEIDATVAELEKLVDASSMQFVTRKLAELGSLKAAHIREVWQDVPLARLWEHDARILDNAAAKLVR